MSANPNTGLNALQFKTIDGLQIRFALSEEKNGDPILLLSPWPESIYAFLPTWDRFSRLGSVVAVDLPGFGRSQSRSDVMAPASGSLCSCESSRNLQEHDHRQRRYRPH
jgi:pimeloyl-ACP methyl ester carboxylesterase